MVRIVTDSAAAIDPSTARRLDIAVVPLRIRVDGEEYRDGIEIGAEELLLRMGRERIRPRVVGPTAADFHEVYSRLTRETDQIVSLHSSASLSATRSEARAAAGAFLGRCDIVVMDSETLSLGLDLLVQEAAELARSAVPLTDIVRHIRGMIRHVYIVLVTESLDYLEHSGRISSAQAILGTMLDIKPFLAIEEGEIIPMEKGRGRPMDKLIEFASEFSAVERIAILQSTPYATEQTRALRDRLNIIVPGHEYPVLLYGPLLASHVGPDATGLVVYEGMDKDELF
jgi:DegV family protein with EDD domain